MNYIETLNPFGLARPPRWFLRRLGAYDPDLRIFPSTCKAVYHIGRKGRFGGALAKPNPKLPDTLVFHQHGIWPWKELLPQSIGFGWQRVLQDLPEYDTQQFADPAGQLDAVEARAEQALDKQIADEAEQRAGAMYRTLGLIEGFRVGSGSRPEGAGYRPLGPETRAPRQRAYRPIGEDVIGGMFVGR